MSLFYQNRPIWRIFTLPLLALVLAVLAAVASESLSNVTPIKKGDEQSRHKNII